MQFKHNSLLKYASLPKITKKLIKNQLFCRSNVIQDHRCWYIWKARQQFLLWHAEILCLSGHSHAR